MSISVVTVCKNAKADISRTIESVLEQTNTEFEYLIIDGKSSDGTIEILSGYCPMLEAKGISVRVISEDDGGIYNAMNKALDLALGEWINFLNAGDEFCDSEVIQDVTKILSHADHISVLFGDYYKTRVKVDQRQDVLCKARDIDSMTNNMPFCHQAVFAKKSVLQNYKFDEKFRIAADYDVFLRMYLANEKFQHIERAIAYFYMNGTSQQNVHQLQVENRNIYIKNGIWDYKKAIKEMQFDWRMLKSKIRKIVFWDKK